MEIMYTGNGWFTEVEKKPIFMDPEEQRRIYTQTCLFERPKWKRVWYFIFGWPKRFKPTGYKGNIFIAMKDLKDHPFIIGDCEKFKWRINVPDKK